MCVCVHAFVCGKIHFMERYVSYKITVYGLIKSALNEEKRANVVMVAEN